MRWFILNIMTVVPLPFVVWLLVVGEYGLALAMAILSLMVLQFPGLFEGSVRGGWMQLLRPAHSGVALIVTSILLAGGYGWHSRAFPWEIQVTAISCTVLGLVLIIVGVMRRRMMSDNNDAP